MSEFDIIKNTKFPNTIHTIKRDLKNLGIKEGDIVLVHSSMSKIGWVCGDEVTIVQALLETVGAQGTIVMPAHTGGNTNPDTWSHPPVPDTWREPIRNTMPEFNINNTPTRGMGKIAECFRTFEGTVRSNHPQVSFCANGRFKNEIVEKHDLSYALGMNTPLGKLYELNAKVLLLGVGYSNCTCMHVAETLVSNPNLAKKGAAINYNGTRQWVWFDDVDYNSDCFDEIGALFEKKNKDIVYGKIGKANCRVLNLRNIVDFTKDFLEANNNLNLNYAKCKEDDEDKIYAEYKNKLDLYEDTKKIEYEKVLGWKKENLKNGIEKCTKILCNGKEIGYFSFNEENNKAEIDNFFITEEYQNRGFGKKALNHCLDVIKNQNVPMVYSYVFTKDERQIELYTKCGFSVRELIGDTRCVMAKKIDDENC